MAPLQTRDTALDCFGKVIREHSLEVTLINYVVYAEFSYKVTAINVLYELSSYRVN
jgi:hypothetical protein